MRVWSWGDWGYSWGWGCVGGVFFCGCEYDFVFENSFLLYGRECGG